MFKNVVKTSIAVRMTFWMFIVILFISAVISYLSYKRGREYLKFEIMQKLVITADNIVHNLENYLDEKIKDVRLLSMRPTVIAAIVNLNKAFRENGLGSIEYSSADKQIRQVMFYYKNIAGFQDLFLVSPDGGIIFSLNKAGKYLGDNLKTGVHRNDPLGKLFDQTSMTLEPGISDLEYQKDADLPVAFIAAPFIDSGRLLGVAMLQVNTREIYGMVSNYRGLGHTGDIIIGKKVSDKVVFVLPNRHVFKGELDVKSKYWLPIVQAVQGRSGNGLSSDYRGKEVLAVWRYLPSYGWGLVVKIDTQEAFTPVFKLRNWLVFITIIAVLLSLAITFLISTAISLSLKKLSKGAEIIGGGNFDFKINIDNNDEIGQLSMSFNQMAQNLKKSKNDLEKYSKDLEQKVQERVEDLEDIKLRLEDKVAERTRELKLKYDELERSKNAMLLMVEDLNRQAQELRTAQDRIVRSEKMVVVGQLASSVAHELRNPLGVMKNAIYYLNMLGTGKDNPDIKKHLEIISSEIENSDKVISDLMEFSRVKDPTLRPEDINAVLNEVLPRIKVPSGIEVVAKLDYTLPEIEADALQMQQVFYNISTNAIQAMEKGGSLTIVTK